MTTSSNLAQIPSLSYQEIMIPTSCAMMIGFASGATTSGKLAAYQFMVENLHRLPQTRANWFFFQKTKNYKVILGGFKGGLRAGAKLGAWTAGFCTLKEAFTLVPAIERRKSLAGALSGLNIALDRLRPTISPQRLLLGTLMGLGAGLAEDYKTHLEEDSAV